MLIVRVCFPGGKRNQPRRSQFKRWMIAWQRLTFVTDRAQVERVDQYPATGPQVAALSGVTSPGAGLVYGSGLVRWLSPGRSCCPTSTSRIPVEPPRPLPGRFLEIRSHPSRTRYSTRSARSSWARCGRDLLQGFMARLNA